MGYAIIDCDYIASRTLNNCSDVVPGKYCLISEDVNLFAISITPDMPSF